jgi:Uma2 family endonuclease
MSTTTAKQPVPSVPSQPMTVDEFARTPEYDDNRVELIDGYIVRREEMKPAHAGATESLRRRLEAKIPAAWYVREDKPVRIPEWTEPLPDIAVVRGDFTMYLARHPEPADVALIVEVSDTSLARDRGEKWYNYAKAGIPVYWIVNLVDRQVEVYTEPAASGYGVERIYKPGENVPVVVDGTEVGRIAVSDLLI